jgi:exosortase
MNRSVVVLWAAMLLAPLPLLYFYYLSLWQFEQYRYFPVLLVAVGLLFWERWDRQLRAPSGWVAISSIAAGSVTLLLAVLYWSPWIANVGWLMLCFAFLLSQFSGLGARPSLATIWPPMLLLVRLPLNLDQKLTSSLQDLTSRISSHVLDRLQVAHTLTGNVFDLPGGQLFVEQACSGVQSLFTLLFIAFFLVAWMNRSLILLPIYAMAGIFWAAVMNVVRVVAIAVAQEWFATDLAHGWYHEVLGYLCLGAATLLLLSTDRFLRVWFYPLPSDIVVTAKFNPLSAVWNWFFDELEHTQRVAPASTQDLKFWPAAVVGVSFCLIAAQFAFRPAAVAASSQRSQEVMWQPPQDLFGATVGQSPVLGFESIRGGKDIALGDNSDIWNLNIDGVLARIAISQPYNEFHDLCVCYEANGWKQNDRVIVKIPGSDWSYISARFVGPDGRHGTLVFSGLNVNGETLNPIDSSLSLLFSARVRRAPAIDYSNLMVQLWATSPAPLSPDQVSGLVESHLLTREAVRSRLIKP